MAHPVVLFHEALFRIVRAPSLVGERAEKARAAISCYLRALKQAAGFETGAANFERIMIDDELTQLEGKLKSWRLLGADTAFVCDAALAMIRRERLENLRDGPSGEFRPQIVSGQSRQTTGLLVK